MGSTYSGYNRVTHHNGTLYTLVKGENGNWKFTHDAWPNDGYSTGVIYSVYDYWDLEYPTLPMYDLIMNATGGKQ